MNNEPRSKSSAWPVVAVAAILGATLVAMTWILSGGSC